MTVSSQTRSGMRELFISAEVDILYEDYSEALPKYFNLLQIYPENFNFYFRVGQCYLNTPGEKEKSISYLETAAAHINPQYRQGKFRETGAPYDALYYLVNAYRINGNLDKALETYDLFMEDVDAEVYDTTLIRFQIGTCHNARAMMANPVYVVERNLGETINDRFSESNPVVSSDGSMLVFTRELQFYDAVFYSRRVNGRWTPPINMTPELGVDQDYFSSSLSPDGKTLLLYRTDNYEGNIYVSRFNGEKWSNVEKLNEKVNTRFWESHATMSKDGKKLYFTSNRRESMGGLDIFISERDSTGNWGVPVNAGPVINTPYNEETPFLGNNDRSLFFSSRGHLNMGGYDIFRSDLDESGNWGPPVNLGYPVNTTDDDLFFFPAGDGNRGYIAKFDPQGYGKMDILFIEIFSQRNPRSFTVAGIATVENLHADFAEPVKIKAINNCDALRVVSAVTDSASGRYSLRLPQGSYNFIWSSDGAADVSKTVAMPITYKEDTVRIDRVMLPRTDFKADLRLRGDTLIQVLPGELASISLEVEPQSLLRIDLLYGDSLVNLATHRITDSSFDFSIMPEKGDSRVFFSLTDRFGNQNSVSVHIVCKESIKPVRRNIEPGIIERPVVKLAEIPVHKPDTLSSEGGDAGQQDLESSGETTGGPHRCWLWWLALIGLLVILYIIWRSRPGKNKRDEK
ncbi:MAG TPA: hypothetical protein VMV74_08955 [Bacteroidales bacterium]|nr:hypothetical protein [Bacteroidales bacterium]